MATSARWQEAQATQRPHLGGSSVNSSPDSSATSGSNCNVEALMAVTQKDLNSSSPALPTRCATTTLQSVDALLEL